MPRSHALRKGRRSISGQAYLVTFTTSGRTPLFARWPIGCDAARQLSAPGNWQASRLLAWVLMPDHWHGLVLLGEGETLAMRIGWVKSASARQLRHAHPALGRVWAPGYHDHALRSDEAVVDAARYIVMNPVRAGLARRVGDWAFWDAVWVGGGSRP